MTIVVPENNCTFVSELLIIRELYEGLQTRLMIEKTINLLSVMNN